MTRLFAPVLILVLAGCQNASRTSSGSEASEGPELHTYREVGGLELHAYVFSPDVGPTRRRGARPFSSTEVVGA